MPHQQMLDRNSVGEVETMLYHDETVALVEELQRQARIERR